MTLRIPCSIWSTWGDCEQAVEGCDVSSTISPPTWAAWVSSSNSQGALHAQRAHQHAPAARGEKFKRPRASFFFQRLRLQCRQTARPERQPALKEADAYPAMPEDGYGWEKLFSERMCRPFPRWTSACRRACCPLPPCLIRPPRTYDGGREKAPRRPFVARSSPPSRAESTRSKSGAAASRRAVSCISDDCPPRHAGAAHSNVVEPIISGSNDARLHQPARGHRRGNRRREAKALLQPNAPKGVEWRNSDNTLIQQVFGWQPATRACATAWKKPIAGSTTKSTSGPQLGRQTARSQVAG